MPLGDPGGSLKLVGQPVPFAAADGVVQRGLACGDVSGGEQHLGDGDLLDDAPLRRCRQGGSRGGTEQGDRLRGAAGGDEPAQVDFSDGCGADERIVGGWAVPGAVQFGERGVERRGVLGGACELDKRRCPLVGTGDGDGMGESDQGCVDPARLTEFVTVYAQGVGVQVGVVEVFGDAQCPAGPPYGECQPFLWQHVTEGRHRVRRVRGRAGAACPCR